jgi:hypothetical protein
MATAADIIVRRERAKWGCQKGGQYVEIGRQTSICYHHQLTLYKREVRGRQLIANKTR